MSNEKELELKERELALKERELGLKQNGSKETSTLKMALTILIILLLLSAVGFLGADKLKQLGYLGTGNSKELELKEKELALKEKELGLKQKSSKEKNPVTAANTNKTETTKAGNTNKTETVKANDSVQDVGNGRVILVYNASELAPKIGDDVITMISTGDGDYGMEKGVTYTSLELRQQDRAMYFYYATNTGTTQDEINDKNAKVVTTCPNTKPWKTEDKITIQTQPAQGGGIQVTFTNQGKGCFSFIAE